jgi:hypothetical protein
VNYRVDGSYVRGDYRNTFHLLSAGGLDMLVLNLDFGAQDDVLAWADTVAGPVPDRHIIMLTHDYLGTDGQLRGTSNLEDKSLPHTHNPAWNDGVQMWDKFVRKHANVQFVLNGHVSPEGRRGQAVVGGRLVARTTQGRSVYQVLTNYQTFNGGGRGLPALFRIYPRQGRVEGPHLLAVPARFAHGRRQRVRVRRRRLRSLVTSGDGGWATILPGPTLVGSVDAGDAVRGQTQRGCDEQGRRPGRDRSGGEGEGHDEDLADHAPHQMSVEPGVIPRVALFLVDHGSIVAREERSASTPRSDFLSARGWRDQGWTRRWR